MQSFRSELESIENPIVQQDIIDLADKIQLHKEGKIDDDKFRSLRLARGVYGQRQAGVQMIRIKIPFGRMSSHQMVHIANLSEEYGSGNLHATTRQDIQLHYVSLDRTPELWAKLEQDDITLREACGNTVRNITGSAYAGIDPNEPFDVSPYAYAMFKYLLRSPFCQEMGRKFKISFSSSEDDSALSFIHDLGFIPKVKVIDGKEVRGFKVLLGGGLGAQPSMAEPILEFLEEDRLIPFSESIIRVFDRWGERNRRMKARFKFLLKDLGATEILRLAKEEEKALPHQVLPVDLDDYQQAPIPEAIFPEEVQGDLAKYELWKQVNVKPQKQAGYFSVAVKLQNGDLKAERARLFAAAVKKFAADDIRVTINQGYVLRFVQEENIPALYNALSLLDLAAAGFNTLADITACPGTDSCNLAISNSTHIARVLENVVVNEYPEYVKDESLSIKISGCPNACGQHTIASIGIHGSSLKNRENKKILPALQLLIGGGIGKDGQGYLGEKVIKIPSKRGPEALRMLLNDFETHQQEGEYYFNYYLRQGKDYFFNLLKPLANLSTLIPDDYMDWGYEQDFKVETEVGECAGVIVDLVATLLFEVEEKMISASNTLKGRAFADSIYHSYAALVNLAKAMLITKEVKASNQIKVLQAFDEHFISNGELAINGVSSYEDFVLSINKNEPTEAFAEQFHADAQAVIDQVKAYYQKQEASV
ncbi:nitrite/sulfite reductase [Persicobacter psychrovividus]|uniref:Ferredoxin--nitrite reductase n=1 Tax=Persicobacter psychrovividus TaxID=387638 RepID=A0ABN6LF05_9BACT|nr:ferredoxin--nitrite reductase [Persicobacter psychrovividus]